jgi:sec-independent protein translocase protein TatB
VFDFGFSELLLIAVLGLLVLGPERLPRAAKTCGLWVRRARASWYSVKTQFERELADEELRRSLQDTSKEFDGLRKELQQPFEQSLTSPAPPAAPPAPAVAASPTPAAAALAASGGRTEAVPLPREEPPADDERTPPVKPPPIDEPPGKDEPRPVDEPPVNDEPHPVDEPPAKDAPRPIDEPAHEPPMQAARDPGAQPRELQ